MDSYTFGDLGSIWGSRTVDMGVCVMKEHAPQHNSVPSQNAVFYKAFGQQCHRGIKYMRL